MAITLVSVPEEHTPAYNEQWIVASGTNSGQTNFKYVCETYINDVLVSTEKYPPRPDNSLLYFNPQRIVEAYVETDYNFDIDQIEKSTSAVKKVTVAVNEEYGSPVSGFTGTSGDYYVWNASYTAHDFTSYTYTSTSDIKALTLAPASVTYSTSGHDIIHADTKYLLKSFYVPFGNAVIGGLMAYQLRVLAYASNGNLIQDSYIYNIYNSSASIPQRYLITVNCSPYGLNLIKTNNPAQILSQTNPALNVIPATTAYYIYTWYNSTPNINSLDYSVELDDFCSNYDRYVVHFLNSFGNMDSFTFNLVSDKTSTIEKKDYRNTPYYLNTANKLVYRNSEGDRKNYNTIITNKIKLNSDWVSDTVYEWLKDLFTSPLIKLEDANGNLYSVKCTDKDYKERKRVVDKIFNVTIELEFDYQDIRQRG